MKLRIAIIPCKPHQILLPLIYSHHKSCLWLLQLYQNQIAKILLLRFELQKRNTHELSFYNVDERFTLSFYLKLVFRIKKFKHKLLQGQLGITSVSSWLNDSRWDNSNCKLGKLDLIANFELELFHLDRIALATWMLEIYNWGDNSN